MAGETKFTEGPWIVFEHLDSSGLEIGPPYSEEYLKGHVRDVCKISGYRADGVTDQHRANARLIAAAPDFLTAATLAMDGRSCSATEIAISKGAWTALRDALAKATGTP
jgi:hypothetical protein